MSPHDHPHPDLTKNQRLVMKTLDQAGGPLSAYNILDQLREDGFRAPPQVYRALDKLEEYGLIHKLESLNAFVACTHQDCHAHEMVAFTICEDCGDVTEISSDTLTRQLVDTTSHTGFTLKKSTVELRGICQHCQVN